MDIIKELDKEIKELENKERDIKFKLEELRSRRTEIKSGFQVGDVVEDGRGDRGVVSRYDKHFMYWKKFKKDGTLSSVERYCYHMEGYKRVEIGGDNYAAADVL